MMALDPCELIGACCYSLTSPGINTFSEVLGWQITTGLVVLGQEWRKVTHVKQV